MKLSELLLTGRANAVPGKELVNLLGLKDLRELTKVVERERREGTPICASVCGVRGYYLAETPEELTAYLGSLYHREREVSRTRTALENILAQWEAVRL